MHASKFERSALVGMVTIYRRRLAMSSKSFADFVNINKYDAAVVQEGATLYIKEKTDYMSPADMRAEIEALVGDKRSVDAALKEAESDYSSAERVLLTYFADEWDDPANHDAIQRAFTSASSRLPVAEALIAASIVLYAMYLDAHRKHVEMTGGIKRTHVTERKPDGTVKETTTSAPADPPASPSSALGSLFSAIKKALSLP
jgi:hypothetical protein